VPIERIIQTQQIREDDLARFCDRLGVYFHIVPEGVVLIPPSHNVDQLGRHADARSLRETELRLAYVFAMVEGAEEDGLWMDDSLPDAFQ
jgi:hypothetical protein